MIDGLHREIERVKKEFLDKLNKVRSLEEITEIKNSFLSRKRGIITNLLIGLKNFPPDEKPKAGSLINSFKVFVKSEIEKFENAPVEPEEEKLDYTLPEFKERVGRTHIITHIREKIEDIFLNLGYEIAGGPEIELEKNNFTLLNFREDHPAKDEQDTFFIKDFENRLLRTHTSPVQVRYMLNNDPPIKIIAPGKVFRKDEPDATHSPVFHQIEGLLVDKGITFSNLKGTLELFIKAFFGENIKLRFRPSYFPFTEPSAEVDISCFMCFGEDKNCRICKGTGWLEILGSGMVHREVLKNCNIDPDEFTGFAFGMGLERIAILKYGISDLRYLYDNDLRFNRQFG